MNKPWAISLSKSDAAALAGLRLVPGIEVSEVGGQIWLRGRESEAALETKLSGLPARGRYDWLPTGQLRPVGNLIPSTLLPHVQWQPLASWLQVELPAAALPGDIGARVRLRLVRSNEEREADLLLARLEDFRQFAEHAAEVRLQRLRFAANGDGQVLVRGTPLPSLPGKRFVIRAGVAVPSGFGWQPAVGEDVLARAFRASGESLVIWSEDGALVRMHSEQFVPAKRGAIRATLAALEEKDS